MKKFFLVAFLLAITGGLWAQTIMTIVGDGNAAPCNAANGQNPIIFNNAMNGVTAANLHYRQVWALHYRNEVADLDTGDASPVMNLITLTTISGCAGSGETGRCYAPGADQGANFNTVNTADHCKFAWLVEQVQSGSGQFAMMVFGQNAANSLSMEVKQSASRNAGRNCNAVFSDVIGDCGDGSGMPCIADTHTATPDATHMTVDLTWAMPSSSAIIFTADSQDTLGAAGGCSYATYGFNPADNASALSTMITGWEIFYALVSTTPPSGDRDAKWIAIDDEDATVGSRAQVGGAGVYYSLNTSATVVVPNTSGNVVFAVSPIFDGASGVPGRSILGNNSVKLEGVQSKSSVPVNPTPVTFQSFNGTYTDMQHVSLAWVTASETDALGFNVYRSLDGTAWTKVNGAIIPAKGQGGAGASYSYTDNLPKQRVYQRWQYKVEELSSDNQRVGETTTEVTK